MRYDKPEGVLHVIIAGSRVFNDYALLKRVMDRLTRKEREVVVISGGAYGADKLGEKWAFSWWCTVRRHHPDYEKHGKAAPMVRNSEMVKEADALVAFWNGTSPGTKDVIAKAKKAGLKVKIVRF